MLSLWNTPGLGPLIFSVWRADARRKLALASPWVSAEDRLLEVGSGPGSVLFEFRKAGLHVDAIDVTDTSYSASLTPTLYDGRHMPYSNDAYDTAVLLTVLHHTPEPDEILRETARVAKRVIVLEDVYDGAWQRKYTKVADSITNLEFFGHPHSNRSDAEWRESFSRLNLKVLHAEVHPFAAFFKQALYVVEKSAS